MFGLFPIAAATFNGGNWVPLTYGGADGGPILAGGFKPGTTPAPKAELIASLPAGKVIPGAKFKGLF